MQLCHESHLLSVAVKRSSSQMANRGSGLCQIRNTHNPRWGVAICNAQQPFDEETTRRGLMSAAGLGFASAGALVGGAASFRLVSAAVVSGYPSPPALPQSTYAVGVTEARVGSPGKTIRARVFYPATPTSGLTGQGKESPYFPYGRETSDGLAGLVYFPSFLLAHLSTASSGCWADAPLAATADGKPWPTVVYSHGLGGNADMGAYAMRRMAAEGQVVISLEHQDGSASFAKTEEGARVPFDGGRARGFEHRVQETVEAARTLQQSLRGCLGGTLSDAISPESLAVGGHSYGCPTVMVACQEAPELFQHVILHDPAITSGTKASQGGTGGVPAQYVLADGYWGSRRIREGVETAMLRSGPGSTISHLSGAEHGNFVDAAFWAPLWVMRNLPLIPAAGSMDPREAHSTMAAMALEFSRSSSSKTTATQ